MIIVVMGVAGSGKTTIGAMLAETLGCEYLEGDTLHPEANIAAMRSGVGLQDAERAVWLAAIHARLLQAFREGRSLVVGCSALRESYRRILADGVQITWVYLRGPTDLIRRRLEQRVGHFFQADLLTSQMETLEEPSDAIAVDVAMTPAVIVRRIIAHLAADADVRIAANADEMSINAASAVAGTIRDVVAARGRCSLMLSGGSTPRGLHRVLAARFRDNVPWAQVHVFWSDERYVPANDERSNYGMARDTLLNHVPCPPANIHPMPTTFADPEDAARAHQAELRSYFGDGVPAFDLAILGIGADGHTASLFPGSPALREEARWVLAVTADAEPPVRLTMTLPVLARSARSWFLVEGASKATALARVLTRSAESSLLPAVAVLESAGSVIWWVDHAAASLLTPDDTVRNAAD